MKSEKAKELITKFAFDFELCKTLYYENNNREKILFEEQATKAVELAEQEIQEKAIEEFKKNCCCMIFTAPPRKKGTIRGLCNPTDCWVIRDFINQLNK